MSMIKKGIFICFMTAFSNFSSSKDIIIEIDDKQNIKRLLLDNSVLNLKLDIIRDGAISYIFKFG